VPGASGDRVHFFAVTTYVLQHPEGMQYRVDALSRLRSIFREALVDDLPAAEIRRRMGVSFEGNGRVRRADGDAVPAWPGVRWERTVRDVLDGGAVNYRESVDAWARSAMRSLENVGSTRSI
jgi:hypothetical protein